MFKIYYDVGNARNLIDVDPVAELKLYGHQRLCQVHVKDKGYLGEGRVDFPGIHSALREIGYKDYIVLETSSPSRDIEADTKRNLEYLKSL
jgi:sugar phosphate isomerase/epimerase